MPFLNIECFTDRNDNLFGLGKRYGSDGYQLSSIAVVDGKFVVTLVSEVPTLKFMGNSSYYLGKARIDTAYYVGWDNYGGIDGSFMKVDLTATPPSLTIFKMLNLPTNLTYGGTPQFDSTYFYWENNGTINRIDLTDTNSLPEVVLNDSSLVPTKWTVTAGTVIYSRFVTAIHVETMKLDPSGNKVLLFNNEVTPLGISKVSQ